MFYSKSFSEKMKFLCFELRCLKIICLKVSLLYFFLGRFNLIVLDTLIEKCILIIFYFKM